MVPKVWGGLVSVPVFWVSRHPEILARGYFDEALLEAIFARELWTPPNALTFERYEVRGDFPKVSGAVVVLPARHHVKDVEWFCDQLDGLEWSVVILAGDEMWEFDWRKVTQTERRKVWIMQPRPEHAHLDGFLPGGWYPNTREWIGPAEIDPLWYRPLSWFFGGQVTHARRRECVEVLRALPDGWLKESEGYLQGIPRDKYTAILPTIKVMPCPSGPMTVDTARPLEGMEAGCVPVVDMVTPRGEAYDYWSLCFGDDCPLTRIWDWSDFPEILAEELEEWPHNSNRIFAWWQGWKRKIVYDLDAQIREVMGE